MKEPYGITIFCDDIRDEVSNKKTLVGVYNGELVIGSLPAVVPTFGLAVTYLEPLEMPVKPVSIKVFVPNKEGKGEVVLDVELPPDREERPTDAAPDPLAEFRAHLLYFRLSPLILQGEGHIKVRAYFDDTEIRLGSLRVRKPTELEIKEYPNLSIPTEPA
jgi:hypothetical protein